jgi:hypothetical protein
MVASMLLKITEFHSFLGPNSSLLCMYPMFSLFLIQRHCSQFCILAIMSSADRHADIPLFSVCWSPFLWK